jgi:hypothetical protein
VRNAIAHALLLRLGARLRIRRAKEASRETRPEHRHKTIQRLSETDRRVFLQDGIDD